MAKTYAVRLFKEYLDAQRDLRELRTFERDLTEDEFKAMNDFASQRVEDVRSAAVAVIKRAGFPIEKLKTIASFDNSERLSPGSLQRMLQSEADRDGKRRRYQTAEGEVFEGIPGGQPITFIETAEFDDEDRAS